MLVVVASVGIVAPTWASDREADEKAARAACLSGAATDGVAILSRLFVESKDPVYIFNQGRCFEQNRRYEDAIARFQEYLRAGKKLSKADRAGAQKHITDCRDLLARQSSPSPSPAPSPAPAEQGKESKERAAKKACLTGDPEGGVAILTDLYLDTNNPTHLFNQGRCFEQNRRYADAIGRFREYLEKAKGLSAGDKADTQRHITNCESYLAGTHEAVPSAASNSEPPKAPLSDKPPAAETKPSEIVVASSEAGAGRPGRGLRVAGGVLAAAGVAGLATGIVLNLKVNSMSNDLEGNWRPGVNSTRESYKTAGWIAYGAGAGCVVAGAILYYVGWRRADSVASVSVVPALGPNMAGTVLVGAF